VLALIEGLPAYTKSTRLTDTHPYDVIFLKLQDGHHLTQHFAQKTMRKAAVPLSHSLCQKR
jgi:hypothetical protein